MKRNYKPPYVSQQTQNIFFCGATAQLGRRPTHCWGFWITSTPGRTPLIEWSARLRGRYL